MANKEWANQLVIAPGPADLSLSGSDAGDDAISSGALNATHAVICDDSINDVYGSDRAEGDAVFAVAPRVLPLEARDCKGIVGAHRVARTRCHWIETWHALAVVRRAAGEDTQAIPAVVVRLIVGKVVDWNALRANIAAARIELGSAADLGLREEPEAVVRRAGGDVALDVVVAVDEPVSGRRRIAREAGEALARAGAQIARDDVLGLNAVLHKVCVATRLVSDVALHAQEVDAMDRDRAVVRVVDGVLAHIRIFDGADHVEVDRIPSHASKLAGIAHFNVLDSCDERLTARAIGNALVRARVQHDVHTMLVELRHRVSLKDHVARKDGHVGPKVNRFAAVELKGLAEVTECERVDESDACAAIEQRINDVRLGLLKGSIIVGRSDDDLAVNVPAHRLLQVDVRGAGRHGLRELGVRAPSKQRLAVQVEGAESARERLGAVDRDLLRDWAAVQRDDRLLHKGLPLRSDDERATHHEDVVGVQVDVDAIKLEDALHDQHVQPNRAVE